MALCSHHSKSSRWRQPWCISHQILNRSSFLYWTTISLWITRKLANLSGFKERSWRNGGCRNSLYEMGWHDHPRSRFHRQTNYENLPLPVLLGVVDMSRDSSITPEKVNSIVNSANCPNLKSRVPNWNCSGEFNCLHFQWSWKTGRPEEQLNPSVIPA
jgi:hypothetical protein